MIPLAEINRIAKNLQISPETIEKDYVISWILLCLSQSMVKENFIFYGGTAIKRVYFDEHRFSEDIDLLSTHKFTLQSILEALSCLEYAKEKANLFLEVNKDNIITTKDRAQLYVNYIGYEEIIGSPKEIRLDFSMDMQLYGKVNNRKIIESYSDLTNLNSELSAMTLNTIFANKLGLLIDITRNEPRDLYDVWFLLQRADKFDFNFNEICDIFREKYSFRPSLSVLIPHLKNEALKRNWKDRLSKQVSELPDFNKILDQIIKELTTLFA